MIYRQINPFLILSLFLFSTFFAWGQEAKPSLELREAYQNFDATIGVQNTDIFTGVEYVEEHRMVNERHKFFGINEFQPITIFYDGQPYFAILGKYNIFEDVLLVKLQSQRGETDFKLLSNRLDGFIFNSTRFVNVWEEGTGFSGIYELLFEDPEMQVLKKHRLSNKKISRRALVHYEFKPRSPEYYFKYKGNYYELTRKNLFDLFPDHKPQVREQYKRYRKQKREQRDKALVSMFQKLSELSNDTAQ